MGMPGEETRQAKEQITQRTPLKRFARFIIGTDLVIDGRIQLQLSKELPQQNRLHDKEDTQRS
jgi:hypothetical protein